MESPCCLVLIVHFFGDSCCVLHCGNGSSDGTIVPLVDHTLHKCKTVLSIRKPKNLKYKEVVWAKNVNNEKTGYHTKYYRKFTALGRNVPPKNYNVESKSVYTRSKSTLASGSSSTGIIPEICIFCTKKTKSTTAVNRSWFQWERETLKKRSINVQQL